MGSADVARFDHGTADVVMEPKRCQ